MTDMHQDVLNFIQTFKRHYGITPVIHHNTGYWFAFVLFRRFLKEGAKILYSKPQNRFAVRIAGRAYDIDGEIMGVTNWGFWDQEKDEELRARVNRENIMY